MRSGISISISPDEDGEHGEVNELIAGDNATMLAAGF
jgi:hypothetical protein